MEDLQKRFLEALQLAASGKSTQAEKAFTAVFDSDPQGNLADDALCNIAILALNQNAIAQAESIFTRLLQDYPTATIAEYQGCSEHGRTGAKALLGLVNCSLARGNAALAAEQIAKLKDYSDSWVDTASGKKTYGELAAELLKTWEQANKEYQEQMK
ncbi:MAG TPA: tetratricopeptide repeat protein [Spirochaetota bacterium]|nr:tetratricopeptide repeat protein [Spirochaetota bacterium]HPH01372.1 tetratricopeptide repeat protein [Spirochaetota bacterium]